MDIVFDDLTTQFTQSLSLIDQDSSREMSLVVEEEVCYDVLVIRGHKILN